MLLFKKYKNRNAVKPNTKSNIFQKKTATGNRLKKLKKIKKIKKLKIK